MTHSLLWASPAVLNVLKFRNYFAHLVPVHTNVLVEELLDAVGAEIQKYGYFLEFIVVCGFVDMNDIGEDFGESGKNVGIEPPLNFWEEVAKDGEFIDID